MLLLPPSCFQLLCYIRRAVNVWGVTDTFLVVDYWRTQIVPVRGTNSDAVGLFFIIRTYKTRSYLSQKPKDPVLHETNNIHWLGTGSRGVISHQHIPESERLNTYCPVFSSSPYSQPSFSSWISRLMISPSSKLSRVLLLPDVWGKMVLTRCFLPTLRPDDWDVDRDRLPSPRLPWSEGSHDHKYS